MGVPKPHLIVVPLSTLPNWERELAKWAPQLYVVSIKGSATSRSTIRQYDTHIESEGQGSVRRLKKDRQRNIRFNIVLTTYETVCQVRCTAWLFSFFFFFFLVFSFRSVMVSKSAAFGSTSCSRPMRPCARCAALSLWFRACLFFSFRDI